jgi:hypothetical protein
MYTPSAATALMVAACDLRSRLSSRSFKGNRQMPKTRSVSGSGNAAAPGAIPEGHDAAQVRSAEA